MEERTRVSLQFAPEHVSAQHKEKQQQQQQQQATYLGR